jgi:membrane-associated phospholipid phosphatase
VRAIFKNNFPFLFPYLIFVSLGGVLLLSKTKIEIQLGFNSFHTSFFDTFFSYVTYLGDGVMAVLTVVILLVVKYRYVLIAGVSNIIASLITQTLKQTLFSEVVRPKKFFEGVHDLYFVPGVENYLYNSFPSGHTTCAFSLYFSLALIVKNKTLKFVFFIVALLAGYSRIYLSQHFFEDVFVGSLIGVYTTLIVFYLIQKNNNNWMEQSLLTSFKNQ